MESKTPVKDRLKKKVKKDEPSTSDEPNIFEMLGKVSDILKQNPEMLNKVNKCVSNIMDNTDLMEKLSSQIKENINLEKESSEDIDNIDMSNLQNILKDDLTSVQGEIQEIVKNVICETSSNLSQCQILDNKELVDSPEVESYESKQ